MTPPASKASAKPTDGGMSGPRFGAFATGGAAPGEPENGSVLAELTQDQAPRRDESEPETTADSGSIEQKPTATEPLNEAPRRDGSGPGTTAGTGPLEQGPSETESINEPGKAPRQRKRAPGRTRNRFAPPPMPERVAETDHGTPLQAKVSKQLHWDFKIATTLQGSSMTRVIEALIDVYNHDPKLVETLIDQAGRKGLGELLHDALLDIATTTAD